MGPSEKQRKPKLGNVNSVFVQPTLPNCQYRTGFPSTFICVQPSHAITSSQPSTWTKRINPVENEPDHSAMCKESQCELPLYFELPNWSCKHISNCILWIVDRLQFAGLPAPRRLQRASGTLERLIHRSTATKTGKVILLSDFETVLKLRRMKMCTQEYIALKLWSK